MPARNITLAADTEAESGAAGPAPAAPGSPLFNLRAAHQARRAQLFVDLPVPRYAEGGHGAEPLHLFCRFGPVSQARMARLAKASEKSKDPERDVRLNAAVLAEACLGVFVVVDSDGQDVKVAAAPVEDATSPENWPTFDDDLAESLGLPAGLPGVDIVRELFLTDGDVMTTATRLAKWSGYALGTEDAEDYQGN